MLRVLLLRAVLVAAPFAIWFAWRAWARRTGRPMAATPWAWLLAAGLVLMGASILLMAAFRDETPGHVYIPGEVQSDGTVSKGHYEAAE